MLSLIIPAYNAGNTLKGLLDSVLASEFKDYEIIAVDDSSRDNTASLIKAYPVRGVFLPSRMGPAAARNKGAEAARGDILVFLDADVRIEPDTLARIAARFRDNPGMKVLVGTYSDKPLNKGFFPRFKALWFKSLFLDVWDTTDSLEGFCAAIDADVFRQSRGFNPAYKNSSAEDYELGCCLRREYTLYFDPGIRVRHNFPGFFRNAVCFFRRTYDFIPLFLGQGRKERGRTLNQDGLASLAAFFSFLLIPFLSSGFIAALYLFLSGVFFCLSLRFIGLAWREEGFLFASLAILTHYVNGIIVGVAVSLGLVRYFVRKWFY